MYVIIFHCSDEIDGLEGGFSSLFELILFSHLRLLCVVFGLVARQFEKNRAVVDVLLWQG